MILNQILEEYKESDNKNEIIDKFLIKLWNSEFTYKKYKKYYKYKVNNNLLNNRQDLIDLFNKYNQVEYLVCKSFYSNSKINAIDYIRIHINNMYGYLFDKDIYYSKKYYNLLLTPKKEYFIAINSIKNNNQVDYNILKSKIDKAFQEVEIIKNHCISKKNEMEFSKYKDLINIYIEKIFDNYISTEEYEKKHGWELNVKIDGWHEDNYVIKYFCKSLTGYMKNYVRNMSSGNYINCKKCGVLIKKTNNRQKFCPTCWKEIRQEQNRNNFNRWYQKQNSNHLETI